MNSLYGMTTLQAFIYSQKYPNDKPLLKFLVSRSRILRFLSALRFIFRS